MIKNLNQLKRTLKENMLLEITGHCREECVGEIRRITKVNTQGFYSTVTSPSDRINPGKNRFFGGARHRSGSSRTETAAFIPVTKITRNSTSSCRSVF